MKLQQLHDDGLARTVEESLRRFDWTYEFYEDSRKFALGKQVEDQLEELVYELWKREPVKALELWERYCPYSKHRQGEVPSFILKRQALGK